MPKNKDLTFDNELKTLAMGVYKGNEKYVPKDWIKIDEMDNPKTGFHGEAFFKNGEVVISFRGTELNTKEDIENDLQMGFCQLPSQYVDSYKFYEKVKKDFSGKRIIFTGHSLGGSLAQLMANETGYETVTFNAYGVANLLYGNIKKDLNIRNYGNKKDPVFISNIDNQLGKTYIINISGKTGENFYKQNKYSTKSLNYHKLENLGDISNAVEYKGQYIQIKEDNNLFKLSIEKNVSIKDIDKNRVITNEEIGEMSQEEFERNENFINQQLKLGRIMTKAQADNKVKSGDLIWVNSYIRADGTEVKGYYRRK